MFERSFQSMGTRVRVMVGERVDPVAADPATATLNAQLQLRDFDRRLSRFREESELARLNRDPAAEVEASALLRALVRAGVRAAELTGGLVDPTLVGALEAAGYARSRGRMESAPLDVALKSAPERRPARPNARSLWRLIEVDDQAGTIRRPPGLKFDSGGVGKGFAADLISRGLASYARFGVDVGGDVRVGGCRPEREPIEIEVRNPLRDSACDRFEITDGAIATSGIDVRLWGSSAKGFRHHLIDPSTGAPAWTGLVCASARAPTALEADVLAKAAVLAGEGGAREILRRHGGLFVREDGSVERVVARTAEPGG